MSLSDDLLVCSDVEGLLCLSVLATEMAGQPLCSAEQPCLNFFPGMGFRPAARVMQRDQYGDHAILIMSGDEAYLSKYDGAVDAYAFLDEPPLPIVPGPVGPILAIPTTVGTGTPGGSIFGFPGFPGFFGGGGGGGHSGPDRPHQPTPSSPTPGGGAHTGGGGPPDLPSLAPVPLSGSGVLMVLALSLLMLKVGHRRLAGALLHKSREGFIS